VVYPAKTDGTTETPFSLKGGARRAHASMIILDFSILFGLVVPNAVKCIAIMQVRACYILEFLALAKSRFNWFI
jgi:hypothetical protein